MTLVVESVLHQHISSTIYEQLGSLVDFTDHVEVEQQITPEGCASQQFTDQQNNLYH